MAYTIMMTLVSYGINAHDSSISPTYSASVYVISPICAISSSSHLILRCLILLWHMASYCRNTPQLYRGKKNPYLMKWSFTQRAEMSVHWTDYTPVVPIGNPINNLMQLAAFNHCDCMMLKYVRGSYVPFRHSRQMDRL